MARIPLARWHKANHTSQVRTAGTQVRHSSGLFGLAGARAKKAPPERVGSFWAVVGGKHCFFRSTWEANVARYYEWLKVKGQIVDWHHEPAVFWFSGVKRGVVSYKPDFRVDELDGRQVWVEVKGFMDARSKTKIRRMAKYHPSVELRVLDAPAYRRLAKQMGPLIEGWQ